MRNFKYIWAVGLVVTALIIIVPIVILLRPDTAPIDDPWAHVPQRPHHTDHTDLMPGPYATGSEVTVACLECHPDAAEQVMATTHWTWLADPVEVAWRDEPVALGKANALNNFCLGIQSNWPGCTSCHAGYGWEDASFDFTDQTAVDCLVCHAEAGTYGKGEAGYPAEGVDLALAAQSVGVPTRANCGTCHFYGGGGDAVKHGDLDSSLTNPPDEVDVHMGLHDFECIDCHQTVDHRIPGRAISVSVDTANRIACTDCHSPAPHPDERLNAHVDAVACQTCHIPYVAVRLPSKVEWDWSTAGQDWPEDPHEYLRIKGSFVYDTDFVPEYYWFNGTVATRYLMGDPIDPTQVTLLNPPAGSISDPDALIWPFKVHRAIQPYDAVYNYLLQPQTYGEGGFWELFDWDQAFERGSEATGLPYSGEYGFVRTDMYWNISHMIAPAEQALVCADCHSPDGRLDWEALGYHGDPVEWGGRVTTGQ